MVRSAQDASGLARQLRRLVAGTDGLLPVVEIEAMQTVREKSLSRERVGASAVALFAAFGLLLAALGTYGVISFTVAQRTAEIGIRLALGATRPRILQLVLRHGLVLACAGVGAGFVGAVVLHAVLRARLVEVHGAHPFLYVGIALLLLGVAVGAAILPARRATAIEPMEALRAN
jgi:ABC-type antimicrobial peptide transport system permease subunit